MFRELSLTYFSLTELFRSSSSWATWPSDSRPNSSIRVRFTALEWLPQPLFAWTLHRHLAIAGDRNRRLQYSVFCDPMSYPPVAVYLKCMVLPCGNLVSCVKHAGTRQLWAIDVSNVMLEFDYLIQNLNSNPLLHSFE